MSSPEVGCLRRRASTGDGFTLLEVMVAVAILGLALTVILSSQAGLFSSATWATRLTVAVQLARCRMSEVELELIKNGYPLIDETEEGPCCDDELDQKFRCEWKIERVELPEAGSLDVGDAGVDFGMDSEGSSEMGPFGALAELEKPPGSAPGDGATPEFGELAGMMMSMVYPDLKPMLEASIRKVTVAVKWKEGSRDRDFSIVQFVTDPMQGHLEEALREQGISELQGQINPSADGLTSPSTEGSSPGLSPGGPE